MLSDLFISFALKAEEEMTAKWADWPQGAAQRAFIACSEHRL